MKVTITWGFSAFNQSINAHEYKAVVCVMHPECTQVRLRSANVCQIPGLHWKPRDARLQLDATCFVRTHMQQGSWVCSCIRFTLWMNVIIPVGANEHGLLYSGGACVAHNRDDRDMKHRSMQARPAAFHCHPHNSYACLFCRRAVIFCFCATVSCRFSE